MLFSLSYSKNINKLYGLIKWKESNKNLNGVMILVEREAERTERTIGTV